MSIYWKKMVGILCIYAGGIGIGSLGYLGESNWRIVVVGVSLFVFLRGCTFIDRLTDTNPLETT